MSLGNIIAAVFGDVASGMPVVYMTVMSYSDIHLDHLSKVSARLSFVFTLSIQQSLPESLRPAHLQRSGREMYSLGTVGGRQ